MAVFSTHSNKGLKNQSLLVPKSVDSMAWEESQQVFQAIKFAKKGKRKKEKCLGQNCFIWPWQLTYQGTKGISSYLFTGNH